ncbi:cytochrome c oxidase subunit II [Candidatus Planktophila lacus]|uniref:cytochrome-c oxidase n=1 Tax=Candidatus Planktophila lacus TaxID=1884913 RepID=A0AAC9YRA2_9ACTN|nr:cytochrome c oxidase subunit II [Candidatus Planktophila lacus]ASY10695.1 cytochrome c oxidase subunit II [Candidatus Planktophila lacus]
MSAHKRSRSLVRLAAPLTLLPLLLSGCSKVSGLGYEEGLSSVNDISLSLWQGAWIAGGVVGVITFVLIIWPAIFHRAKASKGEFPKQTQYNIPVEIAYTIIPFIIVAVLFYYTAVKQEKIVEKTSTYAHEITVNGFQWSWQFSYPEAGPKAVVTGTPAQPPTLVVPIGEKVRYTIESNDVVHGFWIPAFMIQIQNLPGVTNSLEFTANKLGTYPGRCNILCGRNHSQMLFTVKVVTVAEYNAYLETLKVSAA